MTVPDVPVTGPDAEERLAQEGLRAAAWSNGPRDRYDAHHHDYDKVLVATRGSIVFRLPALDRDIALVAGDRLDLPAGTVHAADVGLDGVRCLEAHLPAGALPGGVCHSPGWARAAGEAPSEALHARTDRARTA